MKLDYAIKKAKELLVDLEKMYDEKERGLAIAIHDELMEYNKNFDAFGYSVAQQRLSTRARLILGLGYSEFLAEDDSDDAYRLASDKRSGILKLLGIDERKLFVEIEHLCGREVV